MQPAASQTEVDVGQQEPSNVQEAMQSVVGSFTTLHCKASEINAVVQAFEVELLTKQKPVCNEASPGHHPQLEMVPVLAVQVLQSAKVLQYCA